VPQEKFVITEVPGMRTVPKRDARLTPSTDVARKPDGTVAVTLHLPGCIFPAFRNDGKPSTVKVLDRAHPLAAGAPDVFTLDRIGRLWEPVIRLRVAARGERVDLRRHDEVVFRQAADGVRE
jgi:hypothetical protein